MQYTLLVYLLSMVVYFGLQKAVNSKILKQNYNFSRAGHCVNSPMIQTHSYNNIIVIGASFHRVSESGQGQRSVSQVQSAAPATQHNAPHNRELRSTKHTQVQTKKYISK